MVHGWRASLRLIFALCVLLTTVPMVASAQEDAATGDSQQTVETETGQSVDTATEEPTEEVESTAPPETTVPEPVETEEPQDQTPVEETEEPVPTEETQGTVPIDPDGATETLTATSTATNEAEVQAASQVEAAAVDTVLLVSVQQCGNDNRIGEFQFLPINGLFAADTSTDCQPLSSEYTASVTLMPVDGGAPHEFTVSGGDNPGRSGPIEAGQYTATITIGDDSDTSGTFEIPVESGALLPILYFVGAEPQPPLPPDAAGTGSVSVSQIFCEDAERDRQTDFFFGRFQAQETTGCGIAGEGSASYTLQNVDGVHDPIGPRAVVSGLEVSFDNVPVGSWMLVQDTPTGAQSEPFTVFAEQDTVVNVVTYVDTLEPNFPVEVIVEKIWCEDDERAGETEFTLDSPPPGIIGGPGPLAAAEASTCYEEPPSGERGELTVSLNGVDTDFSDEQTIEFGSSVYFESVPVGTYTVTETVDLSVTSDEFTFTGPLHRVRIINYVAEDTDRPAPPAEGTGSLYGNVYFCSDPDRAEGDVDFIVRAGFVLQDVSTCEAGTATSGQVTLYRLDGPDGEIDPEQTESLYTYPDGTFEAYDIPTGYYRLGYSSPEIDEAAISEPFEIYGYDTRAEINVFTAPVASGHVDVYKDICVDPERAGEALFQVNEPFPAFIGIPQGEFQASASSSCRYATEADGPFTFTLTSVDTGETWTQEMEFDSVFFEGIPSGTYTLTETHDGTTHTSGEFEFEFELDIAGEFGSYEVFVRNFIAEGDFSLPEDQTDNATLEIYGYICTDPERDGEAEFFFYSEPQFLPAATAECRVPGAFDDLSFTAIQTDENGVPLDGATEINFAAGEREAGVYVPTDGLLSEGFYVVTEATTGVSTGVLTLEGDHYLDFLKYAALPRAEVIVYLSSADPSIADTLPDDASWTVSQGDTVLFTDTFAPEHRDLSTEQVIPVENPILYGTYTVTVDGGPDFEPYTAEFVVDEPIEDFFIELQPVQPTTPEPTPTTEPTPGETPTTTPVPGTPTPTPDGTPPAEETTTDVIVTVRTVDGGDIPDGTEVCLTSTDGDYDECLTLDEVAGQMVVAAVPSGTTISFSDVPAGTYALTVPANAPYLAYAETIEVADGEPYEVTVVLQLDDETPPATETPGTDDETPGPDEPDVTPETPDDDGDDSQDDADDSGTSEDADGSDDSDDESVTTLPDTGDGAGRDTISGVITLLLLASALALMAASTLARGSGRTGST